MSANGLVGTRSYEAIVVGGGVGGLSAAAHLATAGKKVLLLERYGVVGGCGHVFRRPGGFQFEVGIHYLGDCGPTGAIPRLLAGLGADRHVEFLPFDRAGFDTIVHPGGRFSVPCGWDHYLANLSQAFPRDADGLSKLVGIMRRISVMFDRTALASTMKTLGKAIRAGSAATWALRPFSQLLDHCRISPEARAVASIQWLSYATPPTRAPVFLHVGFLEGYLGRGAYFPKGGGQTIAASLVRVIEGNGGVVRTSAPVERILIEGGRVRGVQLSDGETIHSSVVVSNVDFVRTYQNLVGPEHTPQSVTRFLDAARMAVPWFNTYLGVKVDLRKWMPATNYFSMPSYADPAAISAELMEHGRRSDPDKWLKAAALRLPAFIHSASRLDPESGMHAPAGHGVIESMTNVPADPELWGADDRPPRKRYRGARYREMKQALQELMIARLETVLPGIRAHIVHGESSTPFTHGRFTGSTDGNAYGLEMNTRQFWRRPRSDGGIKGLFLSGTSTFFGPAIEGVMVSGAVTAGAILGRDLLTPALAGKPSGAIRILPPASGWDPLQESQRSATPGQRRRAGAGSSEDQPEPLEASPLGDRGFDRH